MIFTILFLLIHLQVVAGSHELGQDYEHVTLLWERFVEFARDTESIGCERVSAVNEIADRYVLQLIVFVFLVKEYSIRSEIQYAYNIICLISQFNRKRTYRCSNNRSMERWA